MNGLSGKVLKTLGLFTLATLVWIPDALALPTTAYTDGSFSELFERVARSFEGAPGLLSAIAYIAGIVLCYTALVKTKEHVDSPNNVPLRDPFIRFVIGGALFALPTVTSTAMAMIGPYGGAVARNDVATGTFALSGTGCDFAGGLGAILGGSVWSALTGGTGTIGLAICYIADSFEGLPGLLMSIVYIAGLVVTTWGLFQLKEHVINPNGMPVATPLKKILVGGIFFAFPYFTSIVWNTFQGGDAMVGVDPFAVMAATSLFTGGGTCTGGVTGALGAVIGWVGSFLGTGSTAAPTSTVGGLDCMMIRLVSDLWGPVQLAVSLFCYMAGLICIALAVRRLMESMDKGARGPLGMGTISLMALGGALLAIDTIISTVSTSLFPDMLGSLGVSTLKLYGGLTYAPGLSTGSLASVNAVITTVFAFSFLIGIISIVRGMFILKDVADGGNGSLMAGFTHLLGGGLAVNLGPVITAIQNTLGLSSVGIQVGITPYF